MAISYTVREVNTGYITVDFADGTWANVPITSDQSREQIEEVIGQFNHQPPTDKAFASPEEVPFSVGESGAAPSREEVEAQKQAAAEAQAAAVKAERDAMLVGYAELRANAYPSLGDQLDAAFWARNGDTAPQEAIDQEIMNVKAAYPKDMEPITRGELEAM